MHVPKMRVPMSRLVSARARLDAGNPAGAYHLIAPLLGPNAGEAAPFGLAATALTRLGRHEEALAHYRACQERDWSQTLMEFSASGVSFQLADTPGSASGIMVLKELYADSYGLDDHRIEPGDVILDIGAHIGGVSIYLAKRHPQARIIAYEPSPSNFALLKENLARNEIANVLAVNRAVAGRRGRLRLVEVPGDTSGATAMASAEGRKALAARGFQETEVEAVTLGDVFEAHGIGRCRLLKLDCEGAEHEILADLRVFKHVDALTMELHVPPAQAHLPPAMITEALLRVLRESVPSLDVRIASIVVLDIS